MNSKDILGMRLANQELITTKSKSAAELVFHLGAVQSQDYAGAKWALGQRLLNATDKDIEKAFNKGEILRTHVLRPTWHFVHPEDIRWMLALTGEKVKRMMGTYNRALGLNEEIFERSKTIIENELKNNNYLTRNELGSLLNENKIKWNGNGLAHIVMMAELDGIICSGPTKGKQQTYCLLDERVPLGETYSRKEALSELTNRYFTTHGPASIKDFVWWSGLSVPDAKMGLEMNKASLVSEVIVGDTYYFKPSGIPQIPDKVFLLPNYDEYGIAYKNRDAFFDSKYISFLDVRGNSVFQHILIYKGVMIGSWKKVIKKDSLIVEYKLFEKETPEIKKLIKTAVNDLGKFLKLTPVIN